jgi:hypothetical protein
MAISSRVLAAFIDSTLDFEPKDQSFTGKRAGATRTKQDTAKFFAILSPKK